MQTNHILCTSCQSKKLISSMYEIQLWCTFKHENQPDSKRKKWPYQWKYETGEHFMIIWGKQHTSNYHTLYISKVHAFKYISSCAAKIKKYGRKEMRDMEGKKWESSGIGKLNAPKRYNGHRMVTSSKFSMLHLTTFLTIPPSDRFLHSNFWYICPTCIYPQNTTLVTRLQPFSLNFSNMVAQTHQW